MPLRQQFSTTIYSWDGEMSAEVLFLPKADMATPDTNDPEDLVRSVAEAFDPDFLARVHARNLELGLATFLASANLDSRDIWRIITQTQMAPIRFDVPEFLPLDPKLIDEYVNFAKELLSSSRIPIEESPLSGISLGELFSSASKASPTSLGAMIGWIIAGHHTPLLLLSVPAGIILVRSAVGIAKGLEKGFEEGLHAQIKKLFTPHRARKR